MGHKHSAPRTSEAVDRRVRELVALKHKEFTKDGTLTPLNKIMLQSRSIAATFTQVRRAFENFHKPDTKKLDYADLVKTLAALGSDVEEDVIKSVFDDADFYEDGQLTFREFLVCLSLAYLLDLIPGLSVEEGMYGGARGRRDSKGRRRSSGAGAGDSKATSDGSGEGGGVGASSGRVAAIKTETTASGRVLEPDSPATDMRRRTSASAVQGQAVAIRRAFHLVLEAYMFFDADGKGEIHRDTMVKAMEGEATGERTKAMKSTDKRAHTKPGPALALITEDRFNELDWDRDGNITFKEFVFAFISWIGALDEDEEGGGGGGGGAGGAGARAGGAAGAGGAASESKS